jgi:hypothetical protein
LLLLRWLELVVKGETNVSLNKSVAAGHFLVLGVWCSPFLLAGRGGEEKERCDAIHPVTPKPLAGRGGEERRRCSSVAFASRSGFCPQVVGMAGVGSSGGDRVLSSFIFQAVEVAELQW